MPAPRLLALAFALSIATSVFAAEPLHLKIASGEIQGKSSDDGQVQEFLGIPYAAPPVGPLRWRPPHPVTPWANVRSAQSFGPRCMQESQFADMTFHDPGESEDCLTLNVWAPQNAHPGTKLPVMVWIYGGGFSAGSTSEARQDGAAFARKGVLLISMNYRLNIFGFFAHSALAAESPEHAAGNYGLMDQAAALQWVKQNAAVFGGDPANITVFGESAGSSSVSLQMASPLAKSTLAHAIGESGGAFARSGRTFPSLPLAEANSDAFARDVLGKTTLAELRQLGPAELITALKNQKAPARRFSPDVDGLFLPAPVEQIYAAGNQAHIPLLAGWNQDEGGLPDHPVTPEDYRKRAEQTWGSQAAAFLSAYPGGSEAEARRSTADYDADRFIAASTWQWIEAQTRTGDAPVYRFYFQQLSPGGRYHPPGSGVFHSSEIEYVFGNLWARPAAAWTEADYRLSTIMQDYWINFARTGNPNGPGLPEWKPYSSDHVVMHIEANPTGQPDTTHERYVFLQTAVPATTPPAAR